MSSTGTVLAARDLSVAACPVVALVILRAWLGAGGPSTAVASVPEGAEPVAIVTGHEPFEAFEAEIAYLRHAEEIVLQSAPDIFPRVRQVEHTEEMPIEEPIEVPIEVTEDPVEQVQPAPELLVTSIMAGRNPVAIIDGRAHRTGDKVGPGWSITEITTGRVTISHLDGRTKVIRMERNGP